jgi:murein DD-endopeptidase MepM/ murein hydrolase activator NlpD
VSSAPVRHPEPPQASPARPTAVARHRKRSSARPKRRSKRVWAAAAALWGVVVLVYGWTAMEYGGVKAPTFAGTWLSNAVGGLVTWGGAWANPAQIVSAAIAKPATLGYLNPMRAVSGLSPERIDDGVDFSGDGPVYALGDGVVTNASATNFGWPGGGWITYRLTEGPGRGLMVYVAEDISPAVTVGERVTTSTVIGTMWNGGDGIETGWAQASGLSSESELPEAGGIGGLGPFPTRVGANFDELLVSLGVPAAPNYGQTEYGILPLAYPASW